MQADCASAEKTVSDASARPTQISWSLMNAVTIGSPAVNFSARQQVFPPRTLRMAGRNASCSDQGAVRLPSLLPKQHDISTCIRRNFPKTSVSTDWPRQEPEASRVLREVDPHVESTISGS